MFPAKADKINNKPYLFLSNLKKDKAQKANDNHNNIGKRFDIESDIYIIS